MPARRSRPMPRRPASRAGSMFRPAAPRGKIVQIAASGAEVGAIPGTRQDVTDAALAADRRQLLRQPQLAAVFYRGHQDPRLRVVGAARLSRARQHPRADRVRQQHPGAGSRLRRTERRGEIARRPRLFAVQAANCAAFAAAWAAGADDFVPFDAAPDGRRRHRHRAPGAHRRGAGRAAPLAAAGWSRCRKTRSRRRWRRSAASASMSSRPLRPPGRRSRRLLPDGTIRPGRDHGRGADRARPQGRGQDRRAARPLN